MSQLTPASSPEPNSPLLRAVAIQKTDGSARRPAEEDLSSQEDNGVHSYRRATETPQNDETGLICEQSECSGMTFTRQCEWKKHMDKHNRPYRCLVKGCENLQGFTYGGGLLRHEREVHKMHGDKDLHTEIKRLRHENEEKDIRLRQLEEAVKVLQQSPS
ncbi:hypothetical protein E8E12_000802 [Didymella heteroderae]|uniref:C2H2-type domain-containing protein n=1 Tax=Didymella heteroderae TaxID=1769908 RepID=A0A9P4WFU0_9PLEO|nr:hypothetical protein E8E12_000802 [Didymella heteroderae]